MSSGYKGDPYWLTAKYSGKCMRNNCNQPFKSGERIFYYPKTKTVYYSQCADAAYNDFKSMVQDEDMYNNQY